MCAYCQRLLKYVHPYVHSFGSKKRIVMFYRVAVSLYCLAGTFLEFQSWHLPGSGSPMTFSVDLSLVFFSSWPSNRKFIASSQLLKWLKFICAKQSPPCVNHFLCVSYYFQLKNMANFTNMAREIVHGSWTPVILLIYYDERNWICRFQKANCNDTHPWR